MYNCNSQNFDVVLLFETSNIFFCWNQRYFSLEQPQFQFVSMFQDNYNCWWDLFWNMVQFYSVLNVLVGGCRANYCFDKQSHGYTFLFAQTLRPIAPSNAFLFFTGSLLIFKSFNSCMQATLNFATLQWIRNFWTIG